MTEAEKIRTLVDNRLEQADEALRACAGNLDEGLTRSAVNGAYTRLSAWRAAGWPWNRRG